MTTVFACGYSDFSIKIFDVESGEQVSILEGHLMSVSSLCFSPCGNFLASGSDDHTIKLWECGSYTLLHTFEGHTHAVVAVDFHPSSSRIVSSSFDDTVRVWDTHTHEEIFLLGRRDINSYSACFIDNGERIAVASYNSILIYENSSGSLLFTIENHQDSIQCLLFHAPSSVLASCSSDGTICIWHTPTNTLLRTINGGNGCVSGLSLSPDGARAFSWFSDGNAMVWDIESGLGTPFADEYIHSHSFTCGCFSEDGSKIITGVESMSCCVVWDSVTGEELYEKREDTRQTVYAVACKPISGGSYI